MDAVEGHVLSSALDFLTKEVVRLVEERKVVTFASAAAEARRAREAVEGGRRQAEHVLHKKREQLLEQVVTVHKETAERFTERLLAGAVSKVTAQAAAGAVDAAAAQERADKDEQTQRRLNAKAAAAAAAALAPEDAAAEQEEEEEEDDEDSALVVRDLLSNLVLPEVVRKRLAAEEELAGRRHLAGANAAMVSAFIDVAKATGAVPNAAAGPHGGRLTVPVPVPDHQAVLAEQLQQQERHQ